MGTRISIGVRKGIAVLVLACVWLPASAPASSKQYNPTSGPKVTGPVEVVRHDCLRNNPRLQRFVGSSELCLWNHEYDSLSEANPQTDYGIVWLQFLITPPDDRCVEGLDVWIRVSEGMGLIDPAPSKAVKVNGTKRYRTKLASDADGNALPGEIATVSNSFPLRPKGISKPEVRPASQNPYFPAPGQNEMVWRWSPGNKPTRQPVAIVVGVTVSWGIVLNLITGGGQSPMERLNAGAFVTASECDASNSRGRITSPSTTSMSISTKAALAE